MTKSARKCSFSKIIFWEPSYSPHKSDFIAAVAQLLPDVEIIYVADEDLSDSRKSMGWATPKPEGYRLIIRPEEKTIRDLINNSALQNFHVLAGMRRVPSIVSALKEIRKTNAPFAIMSEPRVREGWKGKLRYLQSWLTESWLRRNTRFVLAIGANGPNWFSSVGYSTTKIFPFAYFINTQKNTATHSDSQSVKIGYLGRLVKEKGVYDIVSACSQLTTPYELIFAGPGQENSNLKDVSNGLGVNTQFIGVIPMSEVSKFTSNLDILILASNTKDGWGVVVSEALLAGTPVIATTNVGASLILDNHVLGHVVQPNSPKKIRIAIEHLQLKKHRTSHLRIARQKWANLSLSSEAGATNFIEILNWANSDTLKRPSDFHLKYPISPEKLPIS